MPTYPSSFNNTAPWSAGPVNDTNLYYEIHNRILRHNLITVLRIVDANVTLGAVTGNVNVQYYDTNSVFNGVATGSVVTLVGQTLPAQNGIFIVSNATGSATGPGPILTRAASLSGITAGVVTGSAAYATNAAGAMNYLNTLFQPTNSTASGPNGYQILVDQAGIAYPQGFVAQSGAANDSPSGVSNANKIVYYTQETTFSNVQAFENLGTLGVSFTTVQKPISIYPSSNTTNGAARNAYNTSTIGDFFINVRVANDLFTQIINFRDGLGSDTTPAQQAYIANLKQEKLNNIKTRLSFVLNDMYDIYRTMYAVQANYTLASGPQTPSAYNRGYSIFH